MASVSACGVNSASEDAVDGPMQEAMESTKKEVRKMV
jgi:hypothetical protein